MIYVANGFLVLWLSGLLVLTGVAMNDIRLVLNNLAPGASYSDFCTGLRLKLMSRIDPDRLTDAGRMYQKAAARHELILLTWIVCGAILLAFLFSRVPS